MILNLIKSTQVISQGLESWDEKKINAIHNIGTFN